MACRPVQPDSRYAFIQWTLFRGRSRPPAADTEGDDGNESPTGKQQLLSVKNTARVSNGVFTETDKLGNPVFFQNRKIRFLAAYKPGFSVLNFYLQCLFTRPY